MSAAAVFMVEEGSTLCSSIRCFFPRDICVLSKVCVRERAAGRLRILARTHDTSMREREAERESEKERERE